MTLYRRFLLRGLLAGILLAAAIATTAIIFTTNQTQATTSSDNPVKSQQAQLSITKQVQNPQGIFGKDASFQNGADIRYLLTVTNTGTTTVDDVKVADSLPAGQTYDTGSTKVKDVSASDGVTGSDGIAIESLAPGAAVNVTFTATVNLPATACGVTKMTNQAQASAEYASPVSDTATAEVTVACAAKCSSLTAPSYVVDMGQNLTFTATATTQGTTVQSYIFKVDGQTVQTSNSNTYDFMSNVPGSHTVSVSVMFADGTTDGGSGSCAQQVMVKAPAAVISCDSLSASATSVNTGQMIAFTAKATAQNANILDYVFSVNGAEVQNTNQATYNFSQSQPGTYTVSVTVHTDQGDATSPACSQQVAITMPAPPVATVSCDSLSASNVTVMPGEPIVFTAKATAQNAQILSYNFSVNGSNVQSSGQSNYNFSQSQPGSYTVSVTVHSDHGDVTSPACSQQVSVQTTPLPIARCDLLNVTPTSVNVGQPVTATTAFTVGSGASFTQATYTFGDETTPSDNTLTSQLDQAGHVTAMHTYNKPGNYTVTVTLDFNVNGQPMDDVGNPNTCVAHETVGAVQGASTPPAAKPTVSSSSPISQLVNTGPGNVIGIFTGMSLVGAFMYRRWLLRRA